MMPGRGVSAVMADLPLKPIRVRAIAERHRRRCAATRPLFEPQGRLELAQARVAVADHARQLDEVVMHAAP